MALFIREKLGGSGRSSHWQRGAKVSADLNVLEAGQAAATRKLSSCTCRLSRGPPVFAPFALPRLKTLLSCCLYDLCTGVPSASSVLIAPRDRNAVYLRSIARSNVGGGIECPGPGARGWSWRRQTRSAQVREDLCGAASSGCQSGGDGGLRFGRRQTGQERQRLEEGRRRARH